MPKPLIAIMTRPTKAIATSGHGTGKPVALRWQS
jgi:hypothetical protein